MAATPFGGEASADAAATPTGQAPLARPMISGRRFRGYTLVVIAPAIARFSASPSL